MGTWNEEAQLLPTGLASQDTFGNAISIAGTTALIGAQGDTANSGAAYVFLREGATPPWAQRGGKLVALQRVPDAVFGFSVAVDGDAALIGAPGHTDYGPLPVPALGAAGLALLGVVLLGAAAIVAARRSRVVLGAV